MAFSALERKPTISLDPNQPAALFGGPAMRGHATAGEQQEPRDMTDGIRVHITQSRDIIAARRAARMVAHNAGFRGAEQVMIVAAVSEIARNIIEHGGCRGSVAVRSLHSEAKIGIEVIAADRGPGIEFPAAAMQQGYSTTNGLGLGLPAARRAFDEFRLETLPGAGTTIVMRKWRNGADEAHAAGRAVYLK